MKNRLFKSSILLSLLFLVDWFASNKPLIDFYQNGKISIHDLLFSMINDSSGYQSSLEYTLIYIIPFLLYLSYVGGRATIVEVTRLKQRKNYVQKKLLHIIISVAFFAGIHEIIAAAGMVYVLPFRMLVEYNYFGGMLVQTGVLSLFYIQTGLLYEICSCLVFGKMALLAAFLVYLIQFYTALLSNKLWLPCDDVTVLYGLLIKELSLPDVMLILVRGYLMGIVLYQFYRYVFERKDLLQYETK